MAEETYDLLVSADGQESIVRSCLEAADERFTVKTYPTDRCVMLLSPLDVPKTESELAYEWSKDMLMIPGAFSKGLQPGYVNYASMSNQKFKGKPSPNYLSYCLMEDGTVFAYIVGTRSKFKNIKGREAEWVEACLIEQIPQVRGQTMRLIIPVAFPFLTHS